MGHFDESNGNQTIIIHGTLFRLTFDFVVQSERAIWHTLICLMEGMAEVKSSDFFFKNQQNM